jgi:hypothetical protein
MPTRPPALLSGLGRNALAWPPRTSGWTHGLAHRLGAPTRQVVTRHGPHPSTKLVTIAATPKPGSSSPTPLLAIVGEAATPFMIETAHVLAGAARAGRSLVLKGQGHDIDPEAVGPVIEEFLGTPSRHRAARIDESTNDMARGRSERGGGLAAVLLAESSCGRRSSTASPISGSSRCRGCFDTAASPAGGSCHSSAVAGQACRPVPWSPFGRAR